MKNIRFSELWSVIISIAIIIGFAVVPQSISDKVLNQIIEYSDNAIADIDEPDKVSKYVQHISSLLDENSKLFHLIYPHSNVTALEEAVDTALQITNNFPDENFEILHELCVAKAAASVLLETDNISFSGIL